MRRTPTLAALLLLTLTTPALATEFHVSCATGDNAADGSAAHPLKTVQAAADKAMPGDTITVHAGTYREWVKPPRGGTDDAHRIVYQAAKGEKVVITGAEPVKGWEKVGHDTWKAVLPNTFFGAFNPYADVVRGDWCRNPQKYHTGAVYLDGDWLLETTKPEIALKPAGKTRLWCATVDGKTTTILAQFPDVDPNTAQVEINVRKTVFTPEKTGINHLTLRGFILRAAATNWAPPTAGQFGVVTAYWCKGWIIEDNDIGFTACSGVALGKFSDQGDNTAGFDPDGYHGTIKRAVHNGWNRETIGGHIVRRNHIHHCEQTGVVGSMGGAFSVICGNDIHDIHLRRLYTGDEMAGIKLHGGVYTEISDNRIWRSGSFGIWLDWMSHGTRVTGNLLHDNGREDIMFEVNHGPFFVANNLLLSAKAVRSDSNGGAFAHNLLSGAVWVYPELVHKVPYFKPRSAEIAGNAVNQLGDDRWLNNILVGGSLAQYDKAQLPVLMAGNVFGKQAQPSKRESAPCRPAGGVPAVKLRTGADGSVWLTFALDRSQVTGTRRPVTAELLGKTAVSQTAFEKVDGAPLAVDTDYFGKARDKSNPFPGPFETPVNGEVKVWPKK